MAEVLMCKVCYSLPMHWKCYKAVPSAFLQRIHCCRLSQARHRFREVVWCHNRKCHLWGLLGVSALPLLLRCDTVITIAQQVFRQRNMLMEATLCMKICHLPTMLIVAIVFTEGRHQRPAHLLIVAPRRVDCSSLIVVKMWLMKGWEMGEIIVQLPLRPIGMWHLVTWEDQEGWVVEMSRQTIMMMISLVNLLIFTVLGRHLPIYKNLQLTEVWW
mmetsp:Transcript_39959/g.48702  ORF Transcript_39959/g.48702 Transcript_39959/m.48702 type:complete len:215 (+) Transcript_39959:2006-2650(+)